MAISLLASILILSLTGIGLAVLWIMALINALRRDDLNESKWLWILLFLILTFFASTAYFFKENRKKLGVISATLLSIFVFTTFYAIAISSFYFFRSR